MIEDRFAARLVTKIRRLRRLFGGVEYATPEHMPPDLIVEKLVQCFWLYGHYPVDSRGPSGLLMDVVKALRPDVAHVIRDEGVAQAWRTYFAEEDDEEDT